MKLKQAIEKLRIDEHYYGKFGKQYRSNSDIRILLNNPLALGEPSKEVPAFLVGGYFHTAILEQHKLDKYKIVNATSRNTKIYKDIAKKEMHLLQSEVDNLEAMIEKVANNRNDLSTYNYFLSKKNLKRKIVFLFLFFCLLILISILTFFLARDVQLIDLWKYFSKYLDF